MSTQEDTLVREALTWFGSDEQYDTSEAARAAFTSILFRCTKPLIAKATAAKDAKVTRLEEEVDRLKGDVARWRNEWETVSHRVAELRSEVERLKADRDAYAECCGKQVDRIDELERELKRSLTA